MTDNANERVPTAREDLEILRNFLHFFRGAQHLYGLLERHAQREQDEQQADRRIAEKKTREVQMANEYQAKEAEAQRAFAAAEARRREREAAQQQELAKLDAIIAQRTAQLEASGRRAAERLRLLEQVARAQAELASKP